MNRNVPVTIREGNRGDTPDLRDQLLLIQEMHHRAYPDIYRTIEPADAEEFLLQRLQDERCFVRVAEINGTGIVGHTVLEIQEKPPSLFSHPKTVLYLGQIVVTPKFRKQGVGRCLIEDLFSVARAHAISRVELNVWEFEGNARRFFADHGFHDFGYRMTHTVVGSD